MNCGELKNFVESIPSFGENLIVCCDPGTDDIVMQAQVNALGKKILGVVPCAGNTGLKHTTNNALILNEITDKENIKVYPGSAHPTKETTQLESGTHVFGAEGLGNLKLPSPIISFEEENGVEFAVNAIKSAKTPVTIISTGGMTDLYKILQRIEKESIHNIAAISIMGGVLDLKQSNAPLSALKEGKPRWAEFNVIYDPTASQAVFDIAQKLNIPILLSTLDLTHTLTYKKEQVESLRKVDNYVAKIMSDLMNDVPVPYLKRFGEAEPQQPAHDLNASMSVFHPNLYTYERGYLTVDGEEKPAARGKTTFTPHANGNVYVLRVPEDRKKVFFTTYEEDLKHYNLPTNIIKGVLYDIRSENDIPKNVERIKSIMEHSNISGELNLAGLLITREIATALVEIVKTHPKLMHVRMSLPKNMSKDMNEIIDSITQICEKNLSH